MTERLITVIFCSRSLQSLLDYTEDDFSDVFDLDFVVSTKCFFFGHVSI